MQNAITSQDIEAARSDRMNTRELTNATAGIDYALEYRVFIEDDEEIQALPIKRTATAQDLDKISQWEKLLKDTTRKRIQQTELSMLHLESTLDHTPVEEAPKAT